jgi:thiamine-phosphate pyrophosphorylase
MGLLSGKQLYTFIDTAYLRDRDPAEVARQLCQGGADLIQLRAKTSSPSEIERMAQGILPVTRAAGVLFVLNDYPALAAKVGADLCHLGQEDFFDAGYRHSSELRKKHGSVPLGLSTHAPEQANRALAAEPAYIAIGPVFATGTKPSAKPVTLEYVRWAAANVTLPWFAIGGINLHTVDEVLAAGAIRICVVSAILNAEDIAAACRDFKKKLTCRSPCAGAPQT